MPLPKGYTRPTPDMVIPMSVTDVFRNYFKNDAPYSFDKAMEAIGHEFIERSYWERPSDTTSISKRRVFTKSKLPSFV